MIARRPHQDQAYRKPLPRFGMRFLLPLGACLLCETAAAQALPPGAASVPRIRPDSIAQDTCRVIGEEAATRSLPPDYFARLIWKESAFSAAAVSPKGAQGIAQFMQATAVARFLKDPLDPAPALAASAHYLADLRKQFGNLGLAAAAYNAGPTRVRDWLDGTGGLPAETRDYVHWITGHSAEEWSATKAELPLPPVIAKLDFDTACVKLALRERAAHVPPTFRRAAGRIDAGEAALGIKQVQPSKPGRVRVMIQIGGSAPAKASKKKRR